MLNHWIFSLLITGLLLLLRRRAAVFALSPPHQHLGQRNSKPVPSPLLDDSNLVLYRVRQALATSTRSEHNITAAYQACQQWKDLLEDSDCRELDDNIKAICLALQASCLVRIGRDDQAIQVFDSALDLPDHIVNAKTKEDVILGKATSLQRLLKYEQARDQFLQSTSERGAYGAATCSLRIGRIDDARRILQEYCQDKSATLEAKGLLGSLLCCTSNSTSSTIDRGLSLLAEASQTSLLYRWIYRVLSDRASAPFPEPDGSASFLDLIKINLEGFDEPSLVQLDDKVNLHNILIGRSAPHAFNVSTFWPESLILPVDSDRLKNLLRVDDQQDLWIRKQRAGYGSHGNEIVTIQEAIQWSISDYTGVNEEECLLQRMVQPPLLLEGYKFSLRIYVISFSQEAQYVSSRGLVKMASMAMRPEDSTASRDYRVQMTNSGRETHMIQKDLVYLREEFERAGWSYEHFWTDIHSSVETVMQTYRTQTAREDGSTIWHGSLSRLGIPKIMGFDFVVDELRKPWLVEVNRFPGMEPRDRADRDVKHKVVRDAWILAGQRAGLQYRHPMRNILGSLDCEVDMTSLERI
jgi:tetratricopeptide (TPR) repeat protein